MLIKAKVLSGGFGEPAILVEFNETDPRFLNNHTRNAITVEEAIGLSADLTDAIAQARYADLEGEAMIATDTSDLVICKLVMLALHLLERLKEDESEFADDIRSLSEPHWYRLTEPQRNEVATYSASLPTPPSGFPSS